ncbi:MAG: peroxide stress protein YaaA [Lachnospiraceae bacterium]|jgi:cytoplasmic iron level regulating protein YaaA (DUF328/UPF0246 family)|nr:peroxide stress protein YaaA [Lachnospiraceae bacterium]
MKIIISPAKKMNLCDAMIPVLGFPALLDQAERLKEYIRSLSRKEVSTMWKCNEKLTELNYWRFQNMDLRNNLTPALLAYEGIQYQYMAPAVFDNQQWEYVTKHLRILSGFYGILRPMDGVVPYRLEMQAKGMFPSRQEGKEKKCKRVSTLYQFWKDDIYKELSRPEGTVIINLASKEYSKAVEPYLQPKDRFVTCVFGQLEPAGKGEFKIKVKGTEAKMARGEMVRFLAAHEIENPEQMKEFTALGYEYKEELSKADEFVFCKK